MISTENLDLTSLNERLFDYATTPQWTTLNMATYEQLIADVAKMHDSPASPFHAKLCAHKEMHDIVTQNTLENFITKHWPGESHTMLGDYINLNLSSETSHIIEYLNALNESCADIYRINEVLDGEVEITSITKPDQILKLELGIGVERPEINDIIACRAFEFNGRHIVGTGMLYFAVNRTPFLEQLIDKMFSRFNETYRKMYESSIMSTAISIEKYKGMLVADLALRVWIYSNLNRLEDNEHTAKPRAWH